MGQSRHFYLKAQKAHSCTSVFTGDVIVETISSSKNCPNVQILKKKKKINIVKATIKNKLKKKSYHSRYSFYIHTIILNICTLF